MSESSLTGLGLDHVGYYVADAEAEAGRLADAFGLPAYATSGVTARSRSIAVGGGRIRILLTEPATADHPGAGYLERHGDGIADIALRVADATAAFEEAVRRGARPVRTPVRHDGVVTAAIAGIGDLTHTFVQRDADDDALPGLRPIRPPVAQTETGVVEVDHFAVCVPDGDEAATVGFYTSVLGFRQTFSERIVIGDQAMTTTVVQSASGEVTFTLIVPDTSCAPGHVVEFLDRHGGAGVQHLAFRADDIGAAVTELGGRGVEFLSTPAVYYTLLAGRMTPARYSVGELRRLNVLVDEDHDGQLYQIFTRSAHPRGTFFYEVIERLGSRSFGNGNIKALYEAVERRRVAEEAVA
jgi:4-hydroxymandelate synthase